ncbi:uncharacterized protein [Amphiura filiformis]|uniref:uncharacterized protein n=1 Tax=Amphiura filiformis TaxID=82378 RepID=UPI003B228559
MKIKNTLVVFIFTVLVIQSCAQKEDKKDKENHGNNGHKENKEDHGNNGHEENKENHGNNGHKEHKEKHENNGRDDLADFFHGSGEEFADLFDPGMAPVFIFGNNNNIEWKVVKKTIECEDKHDDHHRDSDLFK